MDLRSDKVVAGTCHAENIADDGRTNRGGARNGGEGGRFNVTKQTGSENAQTQRPEGPLSREKEIDACRRNGGQNRIDLRLAIERGGSHWLSQKLLRVKDSWDAENLESLKWSQHTYSELLELNILRSVNDSEIWNMSELGTEFRR